MNDSRALPVSPRTHRAGFTLTEIVLALAIIASAFIAVLGLLPAGLNQSRLASDSTVIATVLEDVHNRLQGQALQTGKPTFSPAFFDDHGVFVPASDDAAVLARRFYRADVKISTWKTVPTGTSGLRPVTVSLSWPVDTRDKSGPAIGNGNPKTTVTYGVTRLTGPDWSVIDTGYVPKIEN